MNGCGLCGGELDDHDVSVTITFAPGLRNGNRVLTVPWTLKDWAVCWGCFTGPGAAALRSALADEYIEPGGEAPRVCHTVCAGTHAHAKGRLRRLFSVRQGSRGEPEAWARCPVCLGPCEVERAA